MSLIKIIIDYQNCFDQKIEVRIEHCTTRSLYLLNIIPLPVRENAFGFTSALSFHEYIEQSQYYTELLPRRYDEIRIAADEQGFFSTYPDTLRFVVLVAEDSPETVIILPILMRISDACPRFDLRILREDDHLDLLDSLIDDIDIGGSLGEMDLPMLLIFDEEWQFQAQWGPRPQAANEYLEAWLAENPLDETVEGHETLDSEEISSLLFNRLIHEMRVWYNSGLNHACAVEIRELLSALSDESDAEDMDESHDESHDESSEEGNEISSNVVESEENDLDEILFEFENF